MAIEINSYFPEEFLTNEQSIFNKLGIKRRFIAGEDETALDMAVKAVNGLNSSAVSPDMVFFSTSYPDGVNNAYELIEHSKYETDGCCNVHAACSGFGLALASIAGRIDRFSGSRILIAASERYSPTLVDLTSGQADSSLSQAIFSDGATAMVFTEGEDMEILNAVNYSFPQDISTCLRMPINYSLVRHPAIVVDIPPSENGYFWMDGKGVYEALRTTLPDLITEAVKGAKLEPGQIRMVIPHQASKPMVGILARRLPSMEVYQDLEDGNWSSASIPKAMAQALQQGAIGKEDKVVLAGFGAGLFASVSVVHLH